MTCLFAALVMGGDLVLHYERTMRFTNVEQALTMVQVESISDRILSRSATSIGIEESRILKEDRIGNDSVPPSADTKPEILRFVGSMDKLPTGELSPDSFQARIQRITRSFFSMSTGHDESKFDWPRNDSIQAGTVRFFDFREHQAQVAYDERTSEVHIQGSVIWDAKTGFPTLWSLKSNSIRQPGGVYEMALSFTQKQLP